MYTSSPAPSSRSPKKVLILRVVHARRARLADILNLGDGIPGELADIRIVATINAKRIDIDPAILRPGRLCLHVSFAKLNREKALAIYSRLTHGKELPSGSENATLAEVYRMARDDGWTVEAGTRGSQLGFRPLRPPTQGD